MILHARSGTWCAALLALALARPALADVVSGADALVKVEPSEVHTYACRFPATKTISTCSSTVVLRVERQTDATPTGLVSSTAAGSVTTDCNVTISPDNGVTAGTRAGNIYQVVTTGTFTDGNKYLCNVRVDVNRVRYQP